MLWTPGNDFNWSVDNFGSTYSDAAFGTEVSANLFSANQMGDSVSLLSGASVTEDVCGIAICFAGGFASANIRNYLCNILIDPAGGTSWSVIIEELLVNSPSLVTGGYWYYFPLYLKAGTSIGARQQCSTAGEPLRVGVKLFGKPSHPELVRYGTKVVNRGENRFFSRGTVFTPGNGAMGSYTQIDDGISLDKNYWWCQVGAAITDTTVTEQSCLFDIAVGDDTNKRMCCENVALTTTGAEQTGKEAFGTRWPFIDTANGDKVYVRAACAGTPDSSVSAAAYFLGD